MNADEQKALLIKKWIDPVKKAEDIFRVRTPTGKLIPLKLPEPHKRFLRSGILGTGRRLVNKGLVYRRVNNKGRQEGFSIISAIETILIADYFPDTFQYYIAVRGDQGISWLDKIDTMVRNSAHYPKELGGGSIINWTDAGLKKKGVKVINNSTIIALTANPAGIRGDSAVNVILDEYAWMIMRQNQQEDTYNAIKHFLRQGGQLTAQSTPRVTTDKFWNFVEKADSLGFDKLYNPAIENWKDLDLYSPLFIDFDNERRKMTGQKLLSTVQKKELKEKYLCRDNFIFDKDMNGIKQHPIKIPYPWINLIDLELDRADDLELFKQENLGIPIDERYKLINSKWVYENAQVYNDETGDGTDWYDRKDSYNSFYIGVDLASTRDLTVVTVVEKIGEHLFERCIKILNGNYSIQEDEISALIKRFKPVFCAIDYTGEKTMSDRLEKVHGTIIKKVIFNNSVKAHLAQNLRNLFQGGKYHVLNFTREHDIAIKHLIKVEKHVTETSVKYTGKGLDKEGRDDGFWSKALAAFDGTFDGKQTNTKTVVRKAARHGIEKTKITSEYDDIIKNRKLLEKEDLKSKKFNDNDIEEKRKILIELIGSNIVLCNKKYKPIKNYICMCVDKPSCPYYLKKKRICDKLGITLKEAEVLINGK